jgi:prepilin-type N-terminal cleavage/methylation domain-containing protein
MVWYDSYMILPRGFTLIELLVVVAILGVLSAIVLASLNTSRGKGADATVKSQMAATRPQAELFYDANGNKYFIDATHDVCGTTAIGSTKPLGDMLSAAASITNAGAVVIAIATPGASGKVTCHSTANAWAAEAPLKSNPANMWCVDSAGVSKASPAATYLGANATACP